MPYIYSTLSNNQNFTVYTKESTENVKGLPIREKVVHINGQANVANKKTLSTPRGAVTTVSEEELKALETLPSFKRFVERNFIEVSKSAGDADKVAKNMKDKDKSAQMTKESIKADNDKAKDVKVNPKKST